MVGSGRGEPVSPLPWAGVGCPPRLPRRRPLFTSDDQTVKETVQARNPVKGS